MNPAVRTVPTKVLEQLQQFDTCSVSNAIEQFQVRTRSDGFVNGSVRCLFPDASPTVGYAVTARMRCSATPIAGGCYFDRADWWSYVLTIPAPRFIVAQDVDDKPGLGALFGEIHANICKALDCSAYITNGSVRDLPGVAAAGMQAFAGSLSVSHAYAHIVEFGVAVQIGGLRIQPGDLLHGDRHGVQSIPISIAEELPGKAAEMLEMEKELLSFCRSKDFSLEMLTDKIHRASNRLGTRPGGGSK
jgi:regulator of RNase E activity RraA